MKTNKEYTPIRKFYAWIGFINVIFVLLVTVAIAGFALVQSLHIIN